MAGAVGGGAGHGAGVDPSRRAARGGSSDDDPGAGSGQLGAAIQDSIASVADATDPATHDPFVELDLVDTQRRVAPGGWRRMVVGLGVGLAAGWVVVVAHRNDQARASIGLGSEHRP